MLFGNRFVRAKIDLVNEVSEARLDVPKLASAVFVSSIASYQCNTIQFIELDSFRIACDFTKTKDGENPLEIVPRKWELLWVVISALLSDNTAVL